MDMTGLLSQVMESKLAGLMYKSMQNNPQERRYVPDSTRRAFDSKMRSDAGTYRQSSQNMKDAMAMVSVAQSGVTTIKHHLSEMHKLATEMATIDGLSSAQYATYSDMLREQSDIIQSLAENIDFNGMKLLNGTAGMRDDGVVVLQAGGNPMNQVFTNLLDSTSSDVISGAGTMNLGLLAGEVNIANQAQASDLVANLDKYIQRMGAIEADYSTDIKSLENLSVLFENNADIFENTIQYKEEKEEKPEKINSASYLDRLLAGNTHGSIFSGRS